MRETNFIEQNKEKWEEFEHLLERKDQDPDKLNRLFVQITDDLSYSRTFYPNRSVRVYLNNLAQQIFHNIYKTRKTHSNRFINFWIDELPQLVYQSRSAFNISFLVFLAAFLIGAFSSQMDPEFARVILGDSYVEMTIENIESGDPMAVYKDKGRLGMSVGITANNLFVSFLTFMLGAFFGIGTLAIMIQNGVMVGAFQHFFYEKGLLQESFLTIWTHGTLEISAIIIAGAAGLTMGKGLVFPGTLTRLEAFQISARRGLKIMLGIAPIIITAGFIEGYLTRFTETPDAVRLVFIFLCLFFILGYFVWYPRKKALEGFKHQIRDSKLPTSDNVSINYEQIKTTGGIVTDIFIFCKRFLREISLLSAGAALFFTLVVLLVASLPMNEIFTFPRVPFGAVYNVEQYFSNDAIPFLFGLNILIYSGLTYGFYQLFLTTYYKDTVQMNPKETTLTEKLTTVFKIILGVSIICGLLVLDIPFIGLLFLGLMPVAVLFVFIIMKERVGFIAGISRTIDLGLKNYGKLLSLCAFITILGILFYSILDTFFLWFYLEMIGWNISVSQSVMDQIIYASLVFIALFILNIVLVLYLAGGGFLYFSLVEIMEAPLLKDRISNIGQRQRIQGMEKEEVMRK